MDAIIDYYETGDSNLLSADQLQDLILAAADQFVEGDEGQFFAIAGPGVNPFVVIEDETRFRGDEGT